MAADGAAFVLNDLIVVETGRRRAVGNTLIAAATTYVIMLGARFLSLSTARTSELARTLYQSSGWQLEKAFIEYNVTLPD